MLHQLVSGTRLISEVYLRICPMKTPRWKNWLGQNMAHSCQCCCGYWMVLMSLRSSEYGGSHRHLYKQILVSHRAKRGTRLVEIFNWCNCSAVLCWHTWQAAMHEKPLRPWKRMVHVAWFTAWWFGEPGFRSENQNRILPVLFHRLWIRNEKSKKWFPGSMAAGRSYLCCK